MDCILPGSKSILVSAPPQDAPGGVASFWRNVWPHLVAHTPDRWTYFPVGRTASNLPLLRDVSTIGMALRRNAVNLLLLNPSLTWKSILRDGLLSVQARIHRVPVCLLIHGWNPFYVHNPAWRKLLRVFFRKSTSVMVLAREFRETWLRLVGSERCFLISTAVDDNLVTQLSSTRRHTGGDPVVLFLARIERSKGILEVIQASVRVKNQFSHKLLIAGAGSAEHEARRMASELNGDHITFVGVVTGDDKVNLLRSSHIYALPTSHHEGLPTSVLEAMAAGLPVITCPVGGIRDVLECVPIGKIIAQRNTDLVVDALRDLLSHYGHDKEELRNMEAMNFVKRYCRASEVARRLRNICVCPLHHTWQYFNCEKTKKQI